MSSQQSSHLSNPWIKVALLFILMVVYFLMLKKQPVVASDRLLRVEDTVTQEPVQYLPTQVLRYCNSSPVSIPDNSAAGVSSQITIGDGRLIEDLEVWVDISHGWVGDLVVGLTHQESGKTIHLVDRPGFPTTEQGCGGNNLIAILDDEISSSIESKCSSEVLAPERRSAAISGIYLPEQPLSVFDLGRVTGNWTLTITDNHTSDTGRLNGWCLLAKVSEAPAPPTPTPVLPELPAQARVNNFTVVAYYEHTVTVVGYSPTTVTIQDGSTTYTRSLTQFLDSWSVLGNMAITASP